jgi:hypothetical protein
MNRMEKRSGSENKRERRSKNVGGRECIRGVVAQI